MFRAREATLFFEQRKAAGEGNPFVMPFRPSIMSTSANTEQAAVYAKTLHHRREAEKRVRQRFAEFSLHNASTFTPPAEQHCEALRSQNIRRAAKADAHSMKYDKYLVSNIPKISVPVSMRDKIQNKHG
jgi:hypothetical protein